MKKQVNIALTGLNGYGENFVKELLKHYDNFKLVAVVSNNPLKSKFYDTLIEKGIKIYSTLEICLKENNINLVIVTTPMHIHYKEVTCALKHGANVFCEKPLAPTIDECLEIKELSEKNKLFVAVGFQWSFSKGILELKKDILDRKFGKIKKMKTMVRWTRLKSYFEDSTWKGKNRDENGKYILECLMSNAASHFLHNMLFLTGNELSKAANPISIQGEGYKANEIDGYDTVFMRIDTDTDCELLYLATIASKDEKEPLFEIELENATVYYNNEEAATIIVKTKDGQIFEYNSPDEGRFNHWHDAVDAILNGKQIICDVNTILPEVITVNAAIESIPAVPLEDFMLEKDNIGIWIKNINNILQECFKTEKLPSELEYEWATKAKTIKLDSYKSFSGIAKL